MSNRARFWRSSWISKIALRLKAVDAQLAAFVSRLDTATADYERARQLAARGVTPQARLDQFKTAFDSATNELEAARAERSVIERQAEEGQVLAPAAGRVLSVSVTEGSVMLVGESVATIAANDYLLRLELPERHARFMKEGDPMRVGARGLNSEAKITGEGRIVQVYPELANGRVMADAEAQGLGDYFVGERAQIWISAGKRKTFTIPADYLFKRHGLDYVKVARDGGPPLDVVVQPGLPVAADKNGGERIEIFAPLQATNWSGHERASRSAFRAISPKSFIGSPLTPLFLFAAFALGIVALIGLPREEEPQISVPMVDIQ